MKGELFKQKRELFCLDAMGFPKGPHTWAVNFCAARTVTCKMGVMGGGREEGPQGWDVCMLMTGSLRWPADSSAIL